MSQLQSAPSPVNAGPSGRTAALVLVAAVLVAMLALPVRNWFLQQARIAEAEGRLLHLQEQIEALEAEERRWSDPAVIERQARLRLNYVRPGEVGVVVLEPDVDPPLSAPGPPQTWLDALWRSVDAASGRGDAAAREQFQVRPSAPR